MSYVWPPLQWTASGRPGRHGAAAASRVEVAASDGSVSALGLSSGEPPARAPRMSTGSVVPNDVLVRAFPQHTSSEGLGTTDSHSPFIPNSVHLTVWSLAEPHEICDEDNFGAVVWKETPAGEVAAVRCPRNATGKNGGPRGPALSLYSCPHRLGLRPTAHAALGCAHARWHQIGQHGSHCVLSSQGSGHMPRSLLERSLCA